MSGNSGGSGTAGDRVPLSNAERQRRFRERRKERAAASAGVPEDVPPEDGAEVDRAEGQGPSRGYSWAPFEAGNFAAVKSGAQSERQLVPRAAAVLLKARADPSWPAYLDEPVYAAAVMAWARAEAAAQMYTEYLARQTPEEWSTEVTDAAEVTEGDAGRDGRETRRSRTRKRTPSLEMWRKLEQHASGLRTKLGLDPLARARLGKDIASQQADMAQVMAQMAREESGAAG